MKATGMKGDKLSCPDCSSDAGSTLKQDGEIATNCSGFTVDACVRSVWLPAAATKSGRALLGSAGISLLTILGELPSAFVMPGCLTTVVEETGSGANASHGRTVPIEGITVP